MTNIMLYIYKGEISGIVTSDHVAFTERFNSLVTSSTNGELIIFLYDGKLHYDLIPEARREEVQNFIKTLHGQYQFTYEVLRDEEAPNE